MFGTSRRGKFATSICQRSRRERRSAGTRRTTSKPDCARRSRGTSRSWRDVQSLAGRRVLVTGAAGFLGSHLVSRLIDAGAEICALDQPNARRWGLLERETLAAIVRADVRSLAEPVHDRTLGDIDVVFHLAAVGVVGDGVDVRDLVMSNIDGTLAALLMAQRLGSRFLYCGSCFEYGA